MSYFKTAKLHHHKDLFTEPCFSSYFPVGTLSFKIQTTESQTTLFSSFVKPMIPKEESRNHQGSRVTGRQSVFYSLDTGKSSCYLQLTTQTVVYFSKIMMIYEEFLDMTNFACSSVRWQEIRPHFQSVLRKETSKISGCRETFNSCSFEWEKQLSNVSTPKCPGAMLLYLKPPK